jgi:hypothetical protein
LWKKAPILFPEEYSKLFTDEEKYVRFNTAENPNAVKLPGYKQLFRDPEVSVRECVALNPSADFVFPEEYIKNFIKEWGVRPSIINSQLVYRNLFKENFVF